MNRSPARRLSTSMFQSSAYADRFKPYLAGLGVRSNTKFDVFPDG